MFKKRISYLALVSVMLCVFIVVIVMTIMAGLLDDFKQKNHDFVGDCIVGTDSLVGFAYYEDFLGELQKQDFIEAASAVINGYCLISMDSGERNYGLQLMGIEPVSFSKVSGFANSLYYNKSKPQNAFNPEYDVNLPGFVIGIDLLLVRDSKGNYNHNSIHISSLNINCIPLTAKGALEKAGTSVVNSKTFSFSDTFQSGIARVDYGYIYLPFQEAQILCGMGGQDKRINAVHIKFKPKISLDSGVEKVTKLWNEFVKSKSGLSKADLLDSVVVQSWKSNRRSYIAAMEKEYTLVLAVFIMLGITTIFVVFVVFYMLVSHKTKDIGILKSVGASDFDILKLFSMFASLIGLIGSAVGVFLGWQFLLHINQTENWLYEKFGFQLWDRTIYAIGEIPNKLEPQAAAVIILSAVAACLLGALIPGWLAARLKPAQSLQVNRL